jgi:hypothetical protein
MHNGDFVPPTIDRFSRSAAAKEIADNTIITLRPDSMHTIMLSGYLELNWLNLGWSDPYLVPYAGKKIFLLATSHDLSNFSSFADHFRAQAIYRDNDFLVIDLDKKVSVPADQLAGGTVSPTKDHNRKGYFWPLELTPIWDELLKGVVEKGNSGSVVQ